MNGIDKQHGRIVGLTSCESDLLALQELFLRPGIHTLPIDSLPSARHLVCRMVHSLGCYSEPSYLTLTLDGLSEPLDDSFSLVYDVLSSLSDGPSIVPDDIDDYLLQEFFSDICCIEETPSLRATEWYDHFKQRLYDFDIASRIPVIVIPVSG